MHLNKDCEKSYKYGTTISLKNNNFTGNYLNNISALHKKNYKNYDKIIIYKQDPKKNIYIYSQAVIFIK